MKQDFVIFHNVQCLEVGVWNTFRRNRIQSGHESHNGGFDRHSFHFPNITLTKTRQMISTVSLPTCRA